MPSLRLTDRGLKALAPHPTRATAWHDSEVRGFQFKLTPPSPQHPQGRGSFLLYYRTKDGTERRPKIGDWPSLTVEQARKIARDWLAQVQLGRDPSAEKDAARRAAEGRDTFKAVAATFIQKYAKPNNRSWEETERIFDSYVTSKWGTRAIGEIKRRDVTTLLDEIEENNGPVMADRVLAAIRKLFNWHAARDDEFVSPIVRGMGRTKPKERARTRILADDELRAIWPILANLDVFGALVKFLLLTAQRRDEAATMRWDDVRGNLWTIPAEKYKTKTPNVVPLSEAAQYVMQSLPRFGEYVFTTRGDTPFSGFSKAKRRLDQLVLDALRKQAAARGDNPTKVEPLPHWTLHDLRHTAKTLMIRAGVRPDISERVLGHVIPGVEGVYDRHSYVDEKQDALTKLAALVERIIHPPASNVVALEAVKAHHKPTPFIGPTAAAIGD